MKRARGHLRRARQALLAMLLGGAGATLLAAAPVLRSPIPAQPLDQALAALSRQTGLEFLYDPVLTGNPRTHAVPAGCEVSRALALLLQDTGLVPRLLQPCVATLAPAPVIPPAPSSPAPALPRPANLQPVRVTGFQHDIARALDIKRSGDGLGEALVASDIASFPDTNLAESLQRLPGVAITREAGEGRQISLRGLGAEFTRVRINGMDVLSTNAGIDSHGAINRSRGFDFNVFSSDLFDRISVGKSSDAASAGDGLAGTVDLLTPRPFDQPGPRLSLSAGGLHQDNSGHTSPRVAALASNTWLDGRLGALGTLSYSGLDTLEYGHSTVRWASGGWNLDRVSDDIDPAIVARLDSDAPDALFYPRFNRYDLYRHQRHRLGLGGSVQFQASDAVLLQLDTVFGRLDATRQEYHLDAAAFSRRNAPGLYNTGLAEISVRALDVAGNDIVHGDYGDVDIRSDTHHNQSRTTYRQAVLGLQVDDHSRTRWQAWLGVQTSRFDNPRDDNVFLFAPNRDFSIDYRGHGRIPTMTYGMDLLDPDSWFLDTVRRRRGRTAFQARQAELRVEHTLAPGLTASAGLQARGQSFDSRYWASDDSRYRFAPVQTLGQPLPRDFAAGLGRSDLPQGWLTAPPPQVLAQLQLQELAPALDPGSSWQVRERPLALWWQLQLDRAPAGRAWRTWLGVRASQTQIISSGFSQTGQGLAWTTTRRSDSALLPALNSRLALAPDLLWRLSLRRDLSRPPLAALAPGTSVDSLNRQVQLGNPDLAPIRATAADSALEWYVGQQGLLAASVFYKDIDSFVVTRSQRLRYDQTGLPLALLDQALASPWQAFTVDRPVNGRGTHLRGAELTWQQRWGAWGVQFNHTWAMAHITVEGAEAPAVRAMLPGLSRRSANLTLLWEGARLSVRSSATWRDRYLTAVPGGNGNDVAGVNASFYLDAAVRLRLRGGWSLQLEGGNLSGEVDDQYVDRSNRVYHHARAGWQVFFGVRLAARPAS